MLQLLPSAASRGWPTRRHLGPGTAPHERGATVLPPARGLGAPPAASLLRRSGPATSRPVTIGSPQFAADDEEPGGKGLIVSRPGEGHPPIDLTGVHQDERQPDGAIVCNAGHTRTPRQRDEFFATRARLVEAAQVSPERCFWRSCPRSGLGALRGSGSLDCVVRHRREPRRSGRSGHAAGPGRPEPRPVPPSGHRRRTSTARRIASSAPRGSGTKNAQAPRAE